MSSVGSSTAPRKVLILCLGAIGDVTRALPLAVRLRKSWPQCTLHWAVEPISRSIVEGHPALDRIVVFDRPRGFKAYRKFAAALAAERYDLVLDLQRHLKSGATSLLTRAPRRVGFARRNSREGNWLFNNEHVPALEHFTSKVMQFQAFGDYLGLEPLSPLNFGLAPTEEERGRLLEKLEAQAKHAGVALPEADRRVALILGSTWPSRFWTVAHYRSLIEELHRRHGLLSIMVGGASEREFAQRIMSQMNFPVVNMVEQTSLRELVPLFAETRFAVGSDSGPMHIAAAVGVPVISLWGSTSPRRSAPWGNEQYILQSPIGCSPCYRKRCPGLGTLCMRDIPWQAVAAHAERILQQRPAGPPAAGALRGHGAFTIEGA